MLSLSSSSTSSTLESMAECLDPIARKEYVFIRTTDTVTRDWHWQPDFTAPSCSRSWCMGFERGACLWFRRRVAGGAAIAPVADQMMCDRIRGRDYKVRTVGLHTEVADTSFRRACTGALGKRCSDLRSCEPSHLQRRHLR